MESEKEQEFEFPAKIEAPTLAKKLSDLVLSGKLAEVFAVCETDVGDDFVKKRIMLHFRALAHLYGGAPQKAKLLLIQARRDYGENLSLVRDLACVYHQLSEIDSWRSTYSRLSQLVAEYNEIVQWDVLVRARLVLAKFYEEEGRVASALGLYRECRVQASRVASASQLYLRCSAQVLRLQSLFRDRTELGGLYRELMAVNPQSVPRDLMIEIQHALILAEVSLVGPEHAWMRLESLMSEGSLSPFDQRLLFFDYVEEAFLSSSGLPEAVREWIPSREHLDTFEEEVLRLCLSKPDPQNLPLATNHLAAEVSWACYLRLLVLALAQERDPSRAQELRNKVNLILDGMEPESRPFWQGRMRPYLRPSDFTIVYHPESRRISFQNRQVSLGRKRTLNLIMQTIATEGEIPLDALYEKVWGEKNSPDAQHRLRMSVHRLNEILFDLTAEDRCLEVTDGHLIFKQDLTLLKGPGLGETALEF